MLKLVRITSASKLGPIAATYRAGRHEPFGTCPRSCSLLPSAAKGATTIDQGYLCALLQAVPRSGRAWTYTHFPAGDLPRPRPGQTVINHSSDTAEGAALAVSSGIPAVHVAPAQDTEWPRRRHGVRFIRCPAERHPGRVTCFTCGGGSPLCARPERDYVIVFVAHGQKKAMVGSGRRGGCYATQGNTRLQWNSAAQGTGNTIDETADPEALIHWARSLPPRSLLRHHIAGDIGKPRRIIPITAV